MKKNIKILFILFSCVICNSCIFEYHDQLAYVAFTDDRTIEYRWNLITTEEHDFNSVEVNGVRVGYKYAESFGIKGKVHLTKDVEEGKKVTLVFDCGNGETAYFTFKKDKENNYPMIEWQYK